MDKQHPAVLERLHWLGHSSYRIDRPLVIYIDPWQLPAGSPPADIILVSHEHHDHCSPEDVQAVRGSSTVVIANTTASAKLKAPVTILTPGESTMVGTVAIEAVPAYNTNKDFHPKAAGHIGFILTLDGERLYFAGDTDVIPEMEGMACDVALLPVSGTYVMTADEAVEAARRIQPRVAVPMHYGAGVAGTVEDAQRFAAASPVPVVVLNKE